MPRGVRKQVTTTDPSIWEAMVWALNELVPDLPETSFVSGVQDVIDYRELLDRKKQLIHDILVDDIYEEVTDKTERKEGTDFQEDKGSLVKG